MSGVLVPGQIHEVGVVGEDGFGFGVEDGDGAEFGFGVGDVWRGYQTLL